MKHNQDFEFIEEAILEIENFPGVDYVFHLVAQAGVRASWGSSFEIYLKPVSPYGATKLAGGNLCSLYWKNYGVPTVALKYFMVYGPRQRSDMAIHKFVKTILAN